MDDYHESYDVHDVEIEDWCAYWSPHYFSITMGQIITSNSVTTLNNHFGNNIIVFSTPNVITIVVQVLLAFNPIL